MMVLFLPWLTFIFSTNASLFLGKSNGMATEISSLAPGLDELVVRLGIGRNGLRKTCGDHCNFFFKCAPIPL
jgi:hypothetical protein